MSFLDMRVKIMEVEEIRMNFVAFIERGFYWLTIRQFEYQLNNHNYGL